MNLSIHPGMWRKLFENPTQDTVRTIRALKLFESCKALPISEIGAALPNWELEACKGNPAIAEMVSFIENHPLLACHKYRIMSTTLKRIRLLSQTPGSLQFCPISVQENLIRFLRSAEILADLPEMDAVPFNTSEIEPLASDLTQFRISPHTRRYIKNLYHPERQEQILLVLANIAKNYPLIPTCRQAYAIMLALDEGDAWAEQPFLIRLITNRFWQYRLAENS